MPRPGEHQALVWHHLAVDPADFIMLVVLIESHPVTSAGARIDGGALAAGAHPGATETADYVLRVGPGGVDFFRRRFEVPFDSEAWSGDSAGGAGNAWFGGHVSSSTKAARRSRFSDQKRW